MLFNTVCAHDVWSLLLSVTFKGMSIFYLAARQLLYLALDEATGPTLDRLLRGAIFPDRIRLES